jgi:hypothetical protein
MTQYLTEQNITTAVLICSALCTVASGLLQLAGKTTASNFVGALPTTLHLGPVVQLLLDWAKRNRELASKLTKVSVVFFLLPLSGCAGTLEESRGIANVSTVAGVPVAARQDAICSRYSNVEYATRIAGGVLAVAAGAAGFSAWPVKSEKWEHRLEVATAVSGTASVGSYWVANQQASLYVEKGCAK